MNITTTRYGYDIDIWGWSIRIKKMPRPAAIFSEIRRQSVRLHLQLKSQEDTNPSRDEINKLLEKIKLNLHSFEGEKLIQALKISSEWERIYTDLYRSDPLVGVSPKDWSKKPTDTSKW